MRKIAVVGLVMLFAMLAVLTQAPAFGQTATIPPPPTVTSTAPSIAPSTTAAGERPSAGGAPRGDRGDRDGDGGGGGGGIPVTGTDVLQLALIGVALVGVGVFLRHRATRRTA